MDSDLQSQAPPARALAAWPRALAAVLGLPVLLALVAVATLALALATPSGTRLIVDWLVARQGGMLSVDGLSGNAWQGLSAARVRWLGSSIAVDAADVSLRLDWSSLLERRPVLEQVRVRQVSVATTASDTPARLPDSLRLPVDWQVRWLELESVELRQGGASPQRIGPIRLSAAYGAGAYRIDRLEAQGWGVQLSGARLELGDQAPFALRAGFRALTEPSRNALIDPTIRERMPAGSLQADVELAGSLGELRMSGRIAYAGARAQVDGSLDPLTARFVQPLEARFEGLDPTQVLLDAPAALISGSARWQPADDAIDFDLTNHAAGRLDERRVPVEQVRARLAWAGETVSLIGLELGVVTGGRIQGDLRVDRSRRLKLMSYDGPALDAQLSFDAIDPSALNADWPSLKLTGEAQSDGERLRVVLPAALSDQSLSLVAELQVAGDEVRIDRVDAKLPYASLRGSGRVGLTGSYRFSADGRLDGVDPRRLLERLGMQVPAQASGMLNGDLRAQGEIGGHAPRLDATLSLHDSRLAGQRLAASMSTSYRHKPQRLALDGRFDWGGNQLRVQGAVGEPADRLRVSARLERPEVLDQRFSGSARVDAEFSGTPERPAISARLMAPRWRIADAPTLAIDDVDASFQSADLLSFARSVQQALGDPPDRSAGRAGARAPSGRGGPAGVSGADARVDALPATTESGSGAGAMMVGPRRGERVRESDDAAKAGARLRFAARELRFAAGALQSIRIEADGGVDAHAFRAAVRVAGQALTVAGGGRIPAPEEARTGAGLEGGDPAVRALQQQAVAERTDPWLWSARIDALNVDGALSASLRGAARLDIARSGAVRVQRLALASEGGVLAIDEAAWSSAGLVLRGEAASVSMRPLIDALESGPAAGSTNASAGASAGSAAASPAKAVSARSEPRSTTSDARGGRRNGEPGRASVSAASRSGLISGSAADPSPVDARSDAAERLRSLRLDARWTLAGPSWDALDGKLVAALKEGSRSVDPNPPTSALPPAEDPVIGANRIDVRIEAGRLDGEANLSIPSLRFSRRYTAPDWTLDGELMFSGRLRGTLSAPELVGALRAERLSLFNRSLGWRLRDGRIEARFDGRELTIDTIRFASADGAVTVAGALRLSDRPANRARVPGSDLPVEGRLQLEARRLPVPLGPGQRLLLSGITDLVAAGGELAWRGRLRADEGLIELRSGGVADLPPDVRVLGDPAPVLARAGESGATPSGWTPRVEADLVIDLGDSLKVRGGGVDARLAGELTLAGVLPAAPRVRGSVDVREGTFSAYGRKLEITRGVIRFAGELDNPLLDIVAMRREQQVDAGVSVTGSALAPRIRLVSDPDLPDAQKLSWLVLGTGLDDVSNASQARALSEAALALLGRSDEGLVASLTQRLGIDAVSLGASGSAARDRLGTARLAPPVPGGSATASTAALASPVRQEVVTVSKRLSSRLTLSYERGLSGLWNLVRLQYDITNRLSLRAQSGSENALDLLYFWWFD